jgi:hypothetical protein
MTEFAGSTAVITGGGSGMGNMRADEFAVRDSAGAGTGRIQFIDADGSSGEGVRLRQR